MPALSNPTLWRTKPYQATPKAYILDPPVFWQCSVNQTAFANPLSAITYDNGDSTTGKSFYPGQVIRVESSGGDFKGYCYLRAISGSEIRISRTGKGDVDFADNDVLKFLHWYQPRAKIPFVDGVGEVFKDDDNGWDNQTIPLINVGGGSITLPGVLQWQASGVPIADAGVWYAKELPAGDSTVTVNFDGSNSYAASTVQYQWSSQSVEFYGGGAAVSWTGDTTATPSGEFKEGIHWVTLRATDSGNSYIAFHHVLVVITGDNLPSLSIESLQLQGDIDNGWNASFNVLDSDVSDYPRGAPVIVWADESYGGTAGSLNGDSDREHIKFCGYLQQDTTSVTSFTSDWDVQATSLLGFMRELTGFPEFLEAAPGSESGNLSWIASEVGQFDSGNLDAWVYLYYVIGLNTNFFEVASVELPSYGDSYPLVAVDVPDGTLYDQQRLIADALAAKVTCDHQGRLYYRRNPHYMSDSDRAALTTIVSLLAEDRTETLRINANHVRDSAWMVGWGGVANGEVEAVVKCGAPSGSPGQGRDKTIANGQIVADQNELNTRIGRTYAYRNRYVRDMSLSVINPGLVADPAWQEWVAFTLAASGNTRGLSYSGDTWVLKSVSASYDMAGGWSDEEWGLEIPVALGTPAATTLETTPDGRLELQPLPPFEPEDPVEPDPITAEWCYTFNFTQSSFSSTWSGFNSYNINTGFASGLGLQFQSISGSYRCTIQTGLLPSGNELVAIRLIISDFPPPAGNSLVINAAQPSEINGTLPADGDETFTLTPAQAITGAVRINCNWNSASGSAPYLVSVTLWGNGANSGTLTNGVSC